MSGPSFWEFLFLCVIGLVVLGPKRLPEVASQIGSWIGKARRMTRVMRRQLEEELDLEKGLNVRPKIEAYVPPNEDDTYSPMHEPRPEVTVTAETDGDEPAAEEQPETTGDDDGERKAG